MPRLSSPSDFTNIAPNYLHATLGGKGYYTTHTDVSELLQITPFTGSTTPSIKEVGSIIKRVEERIDEKIKLSYRPIVFYNEYYNFEPAKYMPNSGRPYGIYRDYVGFVQLEQRKIQKLLRLEVWQGNNWKDLASATAKITVPSSVTSGSWTLALGVGGYTFNLVKGSDFYDTFGPKTTAVEIAAAINEIYPSKTGTWTGEQVQKSTTSTVGEQTRNVSDFFFASVDTEDGNTVIISSKLIGDDGQNCTITSTVGSVTNFADNESSARTGDFWQITDDGKIFFLREWPFQQTHSIRVSYISGDGRVPASIHEAATKIVAAEVIRHDDNSILIADTGSNIDLKSKHDILLEEAKAILDAKQETVFLL
tara:strand:+ start:546 stop:1643 length:1098 start_codon:yes stop_codon:yes gene_type:complete